MKHTPIFAIGGGGLAGSGKDYTISEIAKFFPKISSVQKNAGFMKDMLNRAVCKNFPTELNNIEEISYKTGQEMLSEEDFEHVKNENGIIFPTTPQMSIRGILQILGTDIIRSISDNFHIKMLAKKMLNMSEENDLVLVPDVRFENEASFIKGYNASENKYEYLTEASLFSEVEYRSVIESKGLFLDAFGDSEFSNELYMDVVGNSVKADKEHDIKNKIDDSGYSYNYMDEIRKGIIFILRDSDRDLPSHISEKMNTDLIKGLKNTEDEVFHNNITPIESNPQFYNIVEAILIEMINKMIINSEIILDEDSFIDDSNKNITKIKNILQNAIKVPDHISQTINKLEQIKTPTKMKQPRSTQNAKNIQGK